MTAVLREPNSSPEVQEVQNTQTVPSTDAGDGPEGDVPLLDESTIEEEAAPGGDLAAAVDEAVEGVARGEEVALADGVALAGEVALADGVALAGKILETAGTALGTVDAGELAVVEKLATGPVHCGSNMAVSAGPAFESMQWVTVEPVWPEWACDCGFRMDMDAVDPVSSVWLAAVRRQSLQRELTVAQNTLELAFRKAVDAGVEPQELARLAGMPAHEAETLFR